MEDDLPVKKTDNLSALEAEDLTSHSIEELQERAERLRAEIERTDKMRAGKESGRAAAENLFKS